MHSVPCHYSLPSDSECNSCRDERLVLCLMFWRALGSGWLTSKVQLPNARDAGRVLVQNSVRIASRISYSGGRHQQSHGRLSLLVLCCFLRRPLLSRNIVFDKTQLLRWIPTKPPKAKCSGRPWDHFMVLVKHLFCRPTVPNRTPPMTTILLKGIGGMNEALKYAIFTYSLHDW